MSGPTIPFGVGRDNVVPLPTRRRSAAVLEVTTAEPDLNAEVDAIGRELAAMNTRLAFLAGAVDNDSLAGAVLGLIGNNAEEIRTQLRPLREALRNLDGAA